MFVILAWLHLVHGVPGAPHSHSGMRGGSPSKPHASAPALTGGADQSSSWDTSPVGRAYSGLKRAYTLFKTAPSRHRLLQLFVSADGSRKTLPSYSSTWGPGVRFSKKGLLSSDSRLGMSGSYGHEHRYRVKFKWEDIGFNRDRYALGVFLAHSNRFDTPLNAASCDKITGQGIHYSLQATRSQVDLTRRIKPGLSGKLGVSLGHFESSIEAPDRVPHPASSRGLNASFFLVGGTGTAMYETRNRGERSSSGVLAEIEAGLFVQPSLDHSKEVTTANRFGFGLFAADIRKYVQMPWHKSNVVTVRASLGVKEDVAGWDIPVFLLHDMGSDGAVRGLSGGKYVDKHYVSGSLEYRAAIWGRGSKELDVYAFGDAGLVGPDLLTNSSASCAAGSFGLGLCAFNRNDVFVKAGVGVFLDKSVGFHISLNE